VIADIGTAIGSTGSFNTATTGVVFGSSVGNWNYSAQNIVGFRFVAAAGTTHYGWMRFNMGAAGSSGTSMTRTVVDYGYESTAATSILAGAGTPDAIPGAGAPAAIPEPTSMLCTVLTLSSGLLLRRRGKVSV